MNMFFRSMSIVFAIILIAPLQASEETIGPKGINSVATGSLILTSQVSGETPSEKTKTIPLDKIWAYEMPGTRNVVDLDVPAAEKTGKGLFQSEYLSAPQIEVAHKSKLARFAFAI